MIEIKTLTNNDFNEYKRLVSTVNEEFTQDSHYSQTMTDTLIHEHFKSRFTEMYCIWLL